MSAMTNDEMKAYVRRHFEAFVNEGNVDIADETLAPDFFDHDGPGGKPIDREGDKAMMRAMHVRFGRRILLVRNSGATKAAGMHRPRGRST